MKMKSVKKVFFNIFCMQPKLKTPSLSEAVTIEKESLPVSLQSSSASSLDTGTASPADFRGIFRTLEPIWYYHSSLLPPSQHQKQEWQRFDDNNQYMLETALMNSKQECTLQKTNFGPCSVMFKTLKPDRHSMVVLPPTKNASMPSLRPHHGLRPLELYKDVRRTISPVWWFEQDSADGSKGMCRFDEKNQIRLEALSDGRNRLVLSDDAFHGVFTVVLEGNSHRELKEEVRGFLYFESTPQYTSKKNRFLAEGFVDDDEWIPHLERRYSV